MVPRTEGADHRAYSPGGICRMTEKPVSSFMTAPALKKTPLHALHLEKGARMVPFAGYDMPVQYDGFGVLKEHLHTREHAGLFDVSHMGQALLYSPTIDPATALEKIVPSDIIGLQNGRQRYTLLLNDEGGILDDLMVARLNEHTLLLVVNAACKDKDFAYIRQKIGAVTQLTPLDDRALLALQGPKAEQVLSPFFSGLLEMNFMDVITTAWRDADIYISRSGYTGEDGFEISFPAALADAFTRDLLQEAEVRLIGLGARDSLRLEAGLCLYGHDLDEHASPVSANLKWTVPKRRRNEANFAGAAKIMSELNNSPYILRVGLQPQGKAPIREKTELFDDKGRKVGVVTSGSFGPSVDGPIAMGYVDANLAVTGTILTAMVRGQSLPCTIVDLPFVPHRYKKG